RVGVGDDEVAADEAGRDHVVDGVAAGAAAAEDGDPRLQFPYVGRREVDGHIGLSSGSRRQAGGCDRSPAVRLEWWKRLFARVIRSSPSASGPRAKNNRPFRS